MNNKNPQITPHRPKLTPFFFIYMGVCLAAVSYYLLKFSGTRLLGREGEFIFDTILVVVMGIKAIIVISEGFQHKKITTDKT